MCTACDAGTYLPGSGGESASKCLTCPANTLSSTGAGAITECLCLLGHYGSAGSYCTACTRGTYKDATGPGGCTMCPAGTYSSEIGGGSAGVCNTCPDNSDSLEGSSTQDDCICDAGYTGSDGGPCVACDAGTP